MAGVKIAVVGAGIAGLVAARELQLAGAEAIVLEQDQRPGGVIVSERPDRDGGPWVLEGGPDSWLAADPEIATLAADLGIRDRIVSQMAKGSYLWDGADLRLLAEGEAAKMLGFGVKLSDLQAGFLSFKTGMADVVEALAASLRPQSLRRAEVAAAQPTAHGYRLSVTDGSSVEVDGVVIAASPIAAQRLLLGVDAAAAQPLQEVTYLPSLSVSLAYRDEQIGRPLEGTGFLVSRDTGEVVHACTYASSKFPGRAPAGRVLLRAFLSWGEGEATTLAHARLASILRISGEPLWARMFYFPRGIPVYQRGYQEHLEGVRRRLAAFPPIALCGSGYDGPGLSASVRSARAAAALVLAARRG